MKASRCSQETEEKGEVRPVKETLRWKAGGLETHRRPFTAPASRWVPEAQGRCCQAMCDHGLILTAKVSVALPLGATVLVALPQLTVVAVEA